MSGWLGMGLFLWFLFCPAALKAGVIGGLSLGIQVLIPALFPYMVVSQLVIKTGGADWLSRRIRLGKLSPNCIRSLIPALFCGYPAGAKLAADAYHHREITKQEQFLLYAFGNVPGFGFTAAYLGGTLYGSFRLGIVIYVSFLLSAVLLLGVCSYAVLPGEERVFVQAKQPPIPLPQAVVEAVGECAIQMVTLIFFVCFFSGVTALGASFCKHPLLRVTVASLVEITGGLAQAAMLPVGFGVFFTGFSGLCVLFQELSFDKKNAVNLLHLMAARSLYGITAVLLFYGICRIMGI